MTTGDGGDGSGRGRGGGGGGGERRRGACQINDNIRREGWTEADWNVVSPAQPPSANTRPNRLTALANAGSCRIR